MAERGPRLSWLMLGTPRPRQVVAIALAGFFVLVAIAGLLTDTASGFLAGSVAAVIATGLLMSTTADMVMRVRFGLTVSGIALIAIWLLGFAKDVAREEGVQLLYAYLIVGGVLVAAGFALGYQAPRTWLLGVVASIALWVTAALIALGLVFDELVRQVLVFGFVIVAALMLGFATIALIVLARRSDDFEASDFLGDAKLSDLSLVAIAGAIVTGYGLWYGLIIDPLDDEPVLDSTIQIEPMGSVGGQDRFAATSRVSNPTTSRIELYGSLYRVQQGELSEVPQALREATTDASDACLRASLKAQTAACESSLGGLRGPSRAPAVGPVDEISWNRGWSKDYELIQDGELWEGGVVLESGSSAEVSFVVVVDAGVDIVKYEQLFIYGLASRVEALRDDEQSGAEGDTLQNCSNDSQEYRIVSIDPLASLINATEPVRLLVGSDPTEMELAVCRLAATGWQPDPLGDRLGLGHHRLTHEFVYPFEPIRQPQPSLDAASTSGPSPSPSPSPSPTPSPGEATEVAG